MNYGGYMKGFSSQIHIHTHKWINEANGNLMNVSLLKGFLNCILMNE